MKYDTEEFLITSNIRWAEYTYFDFFSDLKYSEYFERLVEARVPKNPRKEIIRCSN